MISINKEPRARPKSNAGEWISFLIVLGRRIAEDDREPPLFESRSGVASEGVTGKIRTMGSGLKTLIRTRQEKVI